MSPRAAPLAKLALFALPLGLWTGTALAHGVASDDAALVREVTGARVVVFAYLGAKHMVTGYFARDP
jgi:hypothetical protein